MTLPSQPGPELVLPFAPAKTREVPAISAELKAEIIGLFDELRDRLLRYILAFGVSVADGEEIIQEAFLSLFQHMRLGRSRHNLRGWLFRVVHDLALKRRSGNGRRCDRLDFDPRQSEVYPDPSPNPEEHAAFRQRHQRLLAVLRALPDQDQQCLRLRAEGLRYREIANVLGLSLGSISASLARSLERMKRVDGR